MTLLLTLLLAARSRLPAAKVELVVTVTPVPFHADGHVFLAYELIIVNRDEAAIEIERIEVMPGDMEEGTAPLVTYTGIQLPQIMVG
jgi:hypothetical protein